MSNIALTGNASGTGTVTVTAPNTNTDRTLTLPDATGTLFSNADLASNAEAAAGVSTTKLMTPALVTYNRANAARTRSGVLGGNFLISTTTFTGLFGTGVVTAATNMALMSCNYQVSANTVTVAQDVFGKFAIYTSGSVLVDQFEMASSLATAQSGLGAAQSVCITFFTPVTPGAGYFVQLDARKSSASNVINFTNTRIDLVFV